MILSLDGKRRRIDDLSVPLVRDPAINQNPKIFGQKKKKIITMGKLKIKMKKNVLLGAFRDDESLVSVGSVHGGFLCEN